MTSWFARLAENVRKTLRRADAQGLPDSTFLLANPEFAERWLGSANDLTPERTRRIQTAGNAASSIAQLVMIQLAASRRHAPATWGTLRPFVFGYVAGLAEQWGRKLQDTTTEFHLFVVVSALCFLHERQANGPGLLNEFLEYGRERNKRFLEAAEAALADFNLPRGVVPTGIIGAILAEQGGSS